MAQYLRWLPVILLGESLDEDFWLALLVYQASVKQLANHDQHWYIRALQRCCLGILLCDHAVQEEYISGSRSFFVSKFVNALGFFIFDYWRIKRSWIANCSRFDSLWSLKCDLKWYIMMLYTALGSVMFLPALSEVMRFSRGFLALNLTTWYILVLSLRHLSISNARLSSSQFLFSFKMLAMSWRIVLHCVFNSHFFIVDCGTNMMAKFLLLVWQLFCNRVVYSAVFVLFGETDCFRRCNRWCSWCFPMKYIPFYWGSHVIAVGRHIWFLLIFQVGRFYSSCCVFCWHFWRLYFSICSLQMTRWWSLDVSVP